jgi:Arsenate reductase and related proteins, glutaredoxin family
VDFLLTPIANSVKISAMVQIIGRAKCRDTQKAIRYFKERNFSFQYVDLKDRELSEKEWASIFDSAGAEACIDTASAYYKKEGYAWRDFDAESELKEHPELLKTPVLREKGKARIGFNPAYLEGASLK